MLGGPECTSSRLHYGRSILWSKSPMEPGPCSADKEIRDRHQAVLTQSLRRFGRTMNRSARGAGKDEGAMDMVGSPQTLAERQDTGGASSGRAQGGAE
jgi:hypothetical protein